MINEEELPHPCCDLDNGNRGAGRGTKNVNPEIEFINQ